MAHDHKPEDNYEGRHEVSQDNKSIENCNYEPMAAVEITIAATPPPSCDSTSVGAKEGRSCTHSTVEENW
jgi:hypothetical protein